MSRAHIAGYQHSDQTFDRVLGHQHAEKDVAHHQRKVDLHHRHLRVVGEGGRIHRVARLARRAEGALRGAVSAFAGQGVAQLLDDHRRVVVNLVATCGLRGHNASSGVQPVDAADFRTLPNQLGGVAQERIAVRALHHQFLGHAAELFLVFDQPQPDVLLCDLGVAPNRIAGSLKLFVAQIPEGENDGCQKQQYRGQWRQRRVTILSRRRLTSPPATQHPTLERWRAPPPFAEVHGYPHGVNYRCHPFCGECGHGSKWCP